MRTKAFQATVYYFRCESMGGQLCASVVLTFILLALIRSVKIDGTVELRALGYTSAKKCSCTAAHSINVQYTHTQDMHICRDIH